MPGFSAPILSIFMPVRDGARYISAALDSLLVQDFTAWELWIADDGSTDETLQIVTTYAGRDARLHVLPLTAGGEVAARNQALQYCHPQAPYRMNHDADDISLPGKLGRLVTHLDKHSEIAILGCLAEYFDDAGRDLGRPEIACDPGQIRADFGRNNQMINSAAVIRREVFECIGGYREIYRSVDDYDFFARALLAGFALANLPETLHRIRLHPGSVGSRRARRQAYLVARVRRYYRLALARNEPLSARLALWLRCQASVARAYLRYRRSEGWRG